MTAETFLRPMPLWLWLYRAALALAAQLMPDTAAPQAADDRQALNRQAERLLDTYGSSVLRYAYSYLHNREDAEEILQETLIRFLRARPVLESPAHEKAWLLRVAANLSKNKLRSESLRRTDELNEELVAEERPDLTFLWEAVSRLPRQYSEAIHLFYHEGYDTRQIAGILGKKESTVRSDLHRGRDRLRRLLREEYGFETEI